MTFKQGVEKAKDLILLIDKYDDIAKQIILAMLVFFPKETQTIIKKIISTETSILLFLVNAISEVETRKVKGSVKKDLVVKKITKAKIVKDPSVIGDLIETGLSFVKSFVN